jgi:hypothetical protein
MDVQKINEIKQELGIRHLSSTDGNRYDPAQSLTDAEVRPFLEKVKQAQDAADYAADQEAAAKGLL